MSLSLEERLLIDRYLEGNLSGIELQQFMERLDADSVFREGVSLQNLLVEGIVICADKELHDNLIKTISYRKSRIPLGLKLILTFLLVTTSGIILWNYVGQDSSDGKKHFLNFSWLDPSESSKNKMDDHVSKSKSSKAVQTMSEEKIDHSNSHLKEKGADDIVLMDSVPSSEDGGKSSELVVKKDQMLISLSLSVQEDTDKKEKAGRKKIKANKDTSLSEKTAGLLNPAAGLEQVKVDNNPSQKMQVEFWVSPINYRGYKWHHNKIILFGMDEPDAVRLFRIDGKLYMHYMNDYYLIEPAEDFTSYQPVNENEFSLEQKK